MPNRSIRWPNVGVMIGDITALARRLDANMPRVQCSSVVTGTMNTLVTKITAGPGPTMLPTSDAATIHQRLSKNERASTALLLAMAFPDPRQFCRVVAGD